MSDLVKRGGDVSGGSQDMKVLARTVARGVGALARLLRQRGPDVGPDVLGPLKKNIGETLEMLAAVIASRKSFAPEETADALSAAKLLKTSGKALSDLNASSVHHNLSKIVKPFEAKLLEASPGSRRDKVAEELFQLAKHTQQTHVVAFNDSYLVVKPDDASAGASLERFHELTTDLWGEIPAKASAYGLAYAIEDSVLETQANAEIEALSSTPARDLDAILAFGDGQVATGQYKARAVALMCTLGHPEEIERFVRFYVTEGFHAESIEAGHSRSTVESTQIALQNLDYGTDRFARRGTESSWRDAIRKFSSSTEAPSEAREAE